MLYLYMRYKKPSGFLNDKEEFSMQYLGIEYNMKHTPKLDPQFVPFGVWRTAYLKDAKKPIAIAVERDKGRVSVHHTCIHGTPEMAEADYRYVERYVKFLLWSIGGFRVSVCGCSELAQRLKKAYDPKGERHFDFTFFNQLYERDLEIVDLPLEDCPAANEVAEPIGGNLDGCRIGFDAGGSDRKVSAVIDGEAVFSEEVVWFPKTNADPKYHYDGILQAMKTAASHMPRVDGIGVSSAGVYVDNRIMIASLFLKVSDEELPLLTGTTDCESGTAQLAQSGIRLIFVTLGANGVFYRFGEKTGHVAGVPCKVGDTNGAGDTFFGAALSKLCKEELDTLTVDKLEGILAFANKAASITTSRHGAIPAMPTLAEVEG